MASGWIAANNSDSPFIKDLWIALREGLFELRVLSVYAFKVLLGFSTSILGHIALLERAVLRLSREVCRISPKVVPGAKILIVSFSRGCKLCLGDSIFYLIVISSSSNIREGLQLELLPSLLGNSLISSDPLYDRKISLK